VNDLHRQEHHGSNPLSSTRKPALDTVANPRVHATTNRGVNEAFAEERASLKALPVAPYRAVLRLERRASHEGMVSVGGNLYCVPDTRRRRIFDVHVLADEIRIFEEPQARQLVPPQSAR
jgi:hypothetical protein